MLSLLLSLLSSLIRVTLFSLLLLTREGSKCLEDSLVRKEVVIVTPVSLLFCGNLTSCCSLLCPDPPTISSKGLTCLPSFGDKMRKRKKRNEASYSRDARIDLSTRSGPFCAEKGQSGRESMEGKKKSKGRENRKEETDGRQLCSLKEDKRQKETDDVTSGKKRKEKVCLWGWNEIGRERKEDSEKTGTEGNEADDVDDHHHHHPRDDVGHKGTLKG